MTLLGSTTSQKGSFSFPLPDKRAFSAGCQSKKRQHSVERTVSEAKSMVDEAKRVDDEAKRLNFQIKGWVRQLKGWSMKQNELMIKRRGSTFKPKGG